MNENALPAARSTEAEIEDLRKQATTDGSPFDYIIVGAGAGGGPLACRLVEAGKSVLLIEAGKDPKKALIEAAEKEKAAALAAKKKPRYDDPTQAVEITEAPIYHGASTEDETLSWGYSVRHYDNDAQQQCDHKYDPTRDPSHPDYQPGLIGSPGTGGGKGGVFYPRATGIGGCTAHHAMIFIRPNDHDWDHIAQLTNDPSWSAQSMQPYFAKVENCRYIEEYRGFLAYTFGLLFKVWLWLMRFINPKSVLDQGGHGDKGWQATSLVSPEVVARIIKTDRVFAEVLFNSVFRVVEGSTTLTAWIKRLLITAGFVQTIDPNDERTRAANPEGGVYLIPLAVSPDDEARDENGVSLKGKRNGPRELILRTQKAHPDRLVIVTSFFVQRVLFTDEPTPRAIGVIGIEGDNLYRAHAHHAEAKAADKPTCYTVKRERHVTKDADGKEVETFGAPLGEVILSGGAFNTPQLLMLSGIGDKTQRDTFNQQVAAANQQRSKEEQQPLWSGLCGKDGKALPGDRFVNLPGVGLNLQDRYEVGVINELHDPLKVLDTLSFVPGDPNDEGRKEWLKSKTGLFTINGGTLAILQRSGSADEKRPGPDLLTFGAPAAFRGYYWNYSKQIYRPWKDAPLPPSATPQERVLWERDQRNDQRNLWTWVVLKAYTRNDGGRVRLRSADPLDTPDICFRSFGEGATKDWEKDVHAMVDAVEKMRAISRAGQPDSPFKAEIQPERYLEEKNATRAALGLKPWNLHDWIKNEAWGHHACGTCRIGSDPHRQFTAELNDENAVLDSHFRVHGVNGLRVVDASVFPQIPGYFIFAPLYMVSEKAADTILKECSDPNYPDTVRDLEMIAVRHRRAEAQVTLTNLRDGDAELAPSSPAPEIAAPRRPYRSTSDGEPAPENLVGLAISGGGVRSATFALGILQTLAAKNRLRQIDFMSTVSGGGFIGSFVGRMFMRDRVKNVADPVARAQELLTDNRSGPLSWLRTQGNYLFASGTDDWLVALGVFFRNLFTVHLVIGALLVAFFGVLTGLSRWIEHLNVVPKLPTFGELLQGDKTNPTTWVPDFLQPVITVIADVSPSAWWWLPIAVLALVVVPMKLGYWLAPKVGSYRSHPFYSLLAWLILLGGASVALTWPEEALWAGAALVVLALSWLFQEVARHQLPDASVKARRLEGLTVRNRLSRGVGEALIIFAVLLLWVVIDTLADAVASKKTLTAMIGALIALAPALWWLRSWALKVLPKQGTPITFNWVKITAFVLAVALVVVVDVIAHTLFDSGDWVWAWGAVLIAFLFSLSIGRAFDFLNLTSLHTAYAVRLARTYLGASNEARFANVANIAADVSVSNPHDDIPHCAYRPEKKGGPLHLINVCCNETVDHASQREIRDNNSLPMAIGSFGVSIGSRYFATWSDDINPPGWLRRRRWLDGLDRQNGATTPPSLKAIPLNSDPNTFHPLGRRDGNPAVVQSLSLADWTAISGAAFSTGVGRGTTPLEALFKGLINLRLGFWWDSGIHATERPGRFPANLWRRLRELPGAFFRTQDLLLAEWRGRFNGPSEEFWNLSDGGHFEQSGVYELIRRRLPFIICTDAMEDPGYTFDDLATLVRLARVDFGAEIEWSCNPATDLASAPPFVQSWINVGGLGKLSEIKGQPLTSNPMRRHSALARITYKDIGEGPKEGWLLLIKASLIGNESLDVTQCGTQFPAFPQDPTTNQTYSLQLWESYRKLGQQAADTVILK